MNVELLPIAEKKIRQMGGEAMGVVVCRDDGILVAVTDSGRVTRLDDAVAGPVGDSAQGAEPVASDEPLSCPFCGDKPEWVKDDDPSWPQVQCKNLECPISHSDWISLDAWNRRAYTQPAAKVPEELAAHIRKMIELHERRSVVLSVHMQELEELLDATPQQSGEWVRCSDRLPTEADADCCGQVWVFDVALGGVAAEYYENVCNVPDYTHWMPTGLKHPNPPKQEGE